MPGVAGEGRRKQTSANGEQAGLPPEEFTLRAIVAGVVLGLVFGAANAYLGLRVGLTVSASIPAAVMAVAICPLRSFPRRHASSRRWAPPTSGRGTSGTSARAPSP